LTPADVALRHTATTFVTNPNVPRGVPNVTPMTLLATPTLPSSSAAERADRLTAAGSAWGERIAADTSAAHLTYTVHGSGQGSVGTALRAGKHEFFIDEPGALAGDDVAASPVEFALGALAACQVVVYRLYAQALGIQVDDIDVKAEGELDARRLFGIDESVRAGFGAVRLNIEIAGPETEERYQQLRDAVDAHCPVLDLFANATPVTTTVSKRA
jgi:putative redox protein